MTPDRWRQVEEVFQTALDLEPTARAAFIDTACAGDEGLKRETLSLIEAYADSNDFLEDDSSARDASALVALVSRHAEGDVVGRYRIVSLLGSGGMGDVYLAHDPRLERRIALKILPALSVALDARLDMFLREARAASALNHPNILTIHEVGEADGVHFIATEYVEGETLREVMSGEEMSQPELLDIAVQIAAALAAAHEAGIVHRDVKPENIMLRRDRIVKVLDFGIAELAAHVALPAEIQPEGEDVKAGALMGTTSYMSPEQACGQVLDERTDVWSFGVVLYEILARRHPFKRATRAETLEAITGDVPPSIDATASATSRAKEKLQDIVCKALAKDRNERYATMAEVLDELKDVRREAEIERLLASDDSAGSSTSSRLAPTHPRPATNSRRNTRPTRIIAALTLAAVIIGASLYSASHTSPVVHEPAATTPPEIKTYRLMSDAERLAYIAVEERRISAMMGERGVELDDAALREIKRGVDRYAARIGSTSDETGSDDLRTIYARAVPHLGLIARSFDRRKVPIVVGIYVPMIESEYRPCHVSPYGAKGMFQFLPQTAKNYGVRPEDMCDPEKMTPAAASYIADRMAELGDDAESMTLVLLSYNRGSEGVRDALRRLRDVEGYERSFWTLFAHRDRLDKPFREENAYYVPLFFAAAIVGENPRVFELNTPPLTSLTGHRPAADTNSTAMNSDESFTK